MPSGPTVSLSNFLNSASSSSSRKRSHAEITRSESRSVSPDLPSKRRRLRPMSNSPSSLFSGSPPPEPAVSRSERDGYDYRRPIMSTAVNRLSQAPDEGTIDLTGEDSDATTVTDASPRPSARRHVQPQSSENRQPRAPPFTRRQDHHDHEVIDLSENSDLQIEEYEVDSDTESERFAPHSLGSSPEVQFLHERPAHPGNRRPEPLRPPHHRLTPPLPDRGGPFGYLPDLFRRGTQFMFGNMQNAYDDIFAAERFDGARPGEVGVRRNEVAPANEPGPELLIHMDYRRPAFALGGLEIFDRSSETPQVIQEPYKAPPAPKDGFIRSFAEDDIVLCPRCGDELATGKDDTKSQVWVVKQCGHVYCGECAANRPPIKGARRKTNVKPPSLFKECVVDDCNSKLTGKLAMFPVYL
ncbi:hypothetical protein LTR20_006892 [Exophiala xenobiotica]|nr:hypothetical protein LTS13_003523 [Exophiala xenobiotica]KAK5392841.1 hypothetical protein LTR79_009744 [Exophiala xenobiotica]KAK5411896.1 hypothetical protein LTR90_007457 [Exophiala xenobiotica]KAK5460467.1 hypothetical protein LTR20_006892 [Exophiala xenobiotica]KAK5481151.1 hypothetical protein LTR26_006986 [Exophiala xenobiotica]